MMYSGDEDYGDEITSGIFPETEFGFYRDDPDECDPDDLEEEREED